jgi:hypothetical protein
MLAEQRLDFGCRPVVAPVVDGNHLAERLLRHCGKGLADQAPDIAFLVKGRDHDGDGHERSLFAKRGRKHAGGTDRSSASTTLYTRAAAMSCYVELCNRSAGRAREAAARA